ncbi:iron-sulfur cluster co-chaperone protein HscB isoform X1 [Alosa sapidissima]|uniref:iron-sulfur cluster co-chaperone protein HscB isoform X1 n=2 Tax=Alosa sapidissima TaxID=34773 RepID=UPI001C0A6071|nr:iron-sulfur cluster co-chaperone protein HscB isoform X1 [Alosa sapidissima]
MLTQHKLRQLCCLYWLQYARKVYGNGQRVLNPTRYFGSLVTFSSNVVGHGRYIGNLLHHDIGSQTVTYVHLATKRLYTNSVNRKCWSCGSSAPSFFCPSCKLVQPPADRTSYFDIMDCEQTFALDTQRLQRTYLHLQRSLHPDNFTRRTSKEQEYSAEQSAFVNKAYRILLKPLSRGLYMLELKGMHLEEGTDLSADPQLLMEVMEINESLAETRSQDEVDSIGRSMRERLKDLMGQINTALNEGDLQSAKALLAQMKYFANIEEKVKDKLSELAESA